MADRRHDRDWLNRHQEGEVVMDQEKRKRLRVPVRFDVSIKLGGKIIKAQLINISLTGILCTSNRLFQQNAPCQVIISLGTDLKITIDSKILRIGEQETAISFITMDEESFGHLKRVVEYNSGDVDRIEKEFRKKAFD
jgi:hypothetical protein